MIDYTRVTETWGLPATAEQVAMAYCRYRMAGDLAQGKRVLEIGCGTGMGLSYLQTRAACVVGGDATLALLCEASRNVPGALLVRLDAQRLPFRDASFDVVLMLEMLYYVSDQHRAFTESKRVLRPGGHLMVCLPNRDWPAFNPSPLSVHYPNADELVRMFESHGFTVRLLGGFPTDVVSRRDRVLRPLRRLAVRYRLIPRSMRAKAVLKRMLYGQLHPLGAIHSGIAPYPEPTSIDTSTPRRASFKNLYAIGMLGQ